MSVDASAEREYAKKINPNLSTRLERIGNAIALVHEGIDVNPTLQQELYGQVYSKAPTFDFVTVDTVSIAARSPDDDKSIVDEFNFYKSRGQVDENNLLTHPHFKGMNFDQFKSKIRAEKSESLDDNANHIPGKEIQPEHQDEIIRRQMSEIFDHYRIPNDSDKRNIFYDTLRKNPEKPFLILYGHGGMRGGEWTVSEESGQNIETLTIVLQKLHVEKYSAVLLVSCNPYGIDPKRVKGATIFYPSTSIGFGIVIRKSREAPSKFLRPSE